MQDLLNKLPMLLMIFPLIAIHEAAHAWVASKLGDDTARDEGRVTLDPLVHIDMIGTVIIPIINVMLGGLAIGFGKPVPVDRHQLRHPYRDEILVALAGPVANLIVAYTCVILTRTVLLHNETLVPVFSDFAIMAIILALLNLIPCPPFDGWPIIRAIFNLDDDLPERMGMWWFLGLLVLLNLPPVNFALNFMTNVIYNLMTFTLP